MEITTENINRWLEEPHSLPDKTILDTSLKTWPWFVPLRLIEATYIHGRRAFDPKALSLLDLYAPEKVTAYHLLTHGAVYSQPPASDMTDKEGSDSTLSSAAVQNTVSDRKVTEAENERLIQPLYTEDYFRHQGIAPVPDESKNPVAEPAPKEDPRTLMVMMSFAEWLAHFKVKSQREQEEEREKSALRSMWQQEKLAAALDEDSEEIPEDVFEMAVNSITREDDIVSEPLARILEKQEKWNAAAEMYRKLGLRNPAKSSYFASRAEAAKKRLQ